MPWEVPITVDGLEYPVRFNTESEPTQADIDEAVKQITAQKQPEKPFVDVSETLAATGKAFTSLGTTFPLAVSQAWSGLDNPWGDDESYNERRASSKRLQEELDAAEEEALTSGDASVVSSAIREATPSLSFSFATLGPSLIAGAGAGALTRSPAAARGAAAATSALMAYRMAGAQFLDDARERIDNFFQQNFNRELTPQEKQEAYQELLPLARKFGAAEAGPEALGNLALGGAGKYIRRALGGKGGVTELASNALNKVTGAKAVAAGAGAAAAEVGTEAITAAEQDRIQQQFEQGTLQGKAPEEVQLPGRAVEDYTKAVTDVAPATLAITGLMGLAGLGPTAISRGVKALRPEQQTQPQRDLSAEANATPVESVPVQTDEEKRKGMEAGHTLVVDPEGNTAYIPPTVPEEITSGLTDEERAAMGFETQQAAAEAPQVEAPDAEEITPDLPPVANDTAIAAFENVEASADVAPATAAALEEITSEEAAGVIASGVTKTPVPPVTAAVAQSSSFDSRNKEMLPEWDDFGGKFDAPLRIKPDSYTSKDGIETVEYTNSGTGITDVYISAFGNNDFIAYMRVYDEQGNPTNRWTSKLERRTDRKGATKAMLTELQSRLPANHQYAEDVSVSTDGLRFIAGQLHQGYTVAVNPDGTPQTTEVAISGESLVNDLPIPVDPNGRFENIRVSRPADFAKIQEYLSKMLQDFGVGLNSSNVRWENGTVFIDLPVLQRTSDPSAAIPPVPPVTTQEQETPVAPAESDGGSLGSSQTVAEGSIPAVTETTVPQEEPVSSAELAPEQPLTTPQENAIPEQISDESLLREERPEVGLPPVAQGDTAAEAPQIPQQAQGQVKRPRRKVRPTAQAVTEDVQVTEEPQITPLTRPLRPKFEAGETVAFKHPSGQMVVGTVQRVSGGGSATVTYNWNGKKEQEVVLRTTELSRPAQALADAPSYELTQEQNTKKAQSIGLPTEPGVTVDAERTIHNALNNVASDPKMPMFLRAVARALQKQSFKGVDLRVEADGRRWYAGYYLNDQGITEIGLNLRNVGRGDVDVVNVFLHEALHHATLAKVRNPQGGLETEAVQALDTLRKRVKAYAGMQQKATKFSYELGNVEEFITAVFTRPDFQNFLASIPDTFAPDTPASKFRSVLSEVFRIIAQLVTGQKVQKGGTLEQAITSTLVLFETPQREVEGRVKEFAPAEQTFYSKLAQVIEQKMPNRADVATIKGIITNPQTGIKQEELKWSGILPWLEEQARRAEGEGQRVSEQAVLDYLASDGAVRLEEVRLGKVTPDIREVKPGVFGFFVDGKRMFAGPQNEAEAQAAEWYATRGYDQRTSAKFAQYQLPGGENYREVVLAMPRKEKTLTEIERELGYETGKLTNEQQNEVLKRWKQYSNQSQEYTSSHFSDVPNYVAHARLNDRVDAEGRPGTFIEEIQSDRHQAGREKGYARKQFKAIGRLRGREAHSLGYDTPEEAEAEIRSKTGYENANIEIKQLDNQGIPDAPFRTTWPLQMFKRALAEAVAQGKQWIGWTTGDTQAERYDLSKQVDKIEVYPLEKSPGMVAITAYKDGRQAIRQDVARGSMADLIGKEAAQKAEQQLQQNNFATLEGDGLKVGGEGMKGFYDTILPKEISKYVKQWGAGVVKSGLPVDNFTSVAEQIASGEGMTPIWRVDITPQMKSGVESGQALFSVASATTQPETPTLNETQAREILTQRFGPKVAEKIIVGNFPAMPLVEGGEPLEVDAFLKGGKIHLNLKFIDSPEFLVSKAEHEMAHAVWQNPNVQAAWKDLTDSMPAQTRERITTRIKELGYDTSLVDEEVMVRFFEEVRAATPPQKWKAFMDAVIDALRRFLGMAPDDRTARLAAARIIAEAESAVARGLDPLQAAFGMSARYQQDLKSRDWETTPSAKGLFEKTPQQGTMNEASKIIGGFLKDAAEPFAARRQALNYFATEPGLRPEVRIAGLGLLAQQMDMVANMKGRAGQEQDANLYDDEVERAAAAKVILENDPNAWQNLKFDIDAALSEAARDAGLALNILNTLNRTTEEGFVRRMNRRIKRQVDTAVAAETGGKTSDELYSEIARLREMMKEPGQEARKKAIAAALKLFNGKGRSVRNLMELIDSQPPKAGFREQMAKEGEQLVRSFFQMIAGPRDPKGPLAEFNTTIQNALSDMLRRVMKEKGLLKENESVQMTDIDKLVRSVSADELRFQKIEAADAAMQDELNSIEDPERRATLQQAWDEAMAKMTTTVAPESVVRRAVNAELKELKTNWNELFDKGGTTNALRDKVVSSVMDKVTKKLNIEADQEPGGVGYNNLGMLQDEIKNAFDFVASVKKQEWLKYRESVELRKRLAEKRKDFLAALRNQKVAESTLSRLNEALAGPPKPGAPKNEVSELVAEHLKNPDPDFVAKLSKLGVNDETAKLLSEMIEKTRKETAEAEPYLKAAKAVDEFIKSIGKTSTKKATEVLTPLAKKILQGATADALDRKEFQDALATAFNVPVMTADQQADFKSLLNRIRAIPEGVLQDDLKKELNAKLAMFDGIPAVDMLTSAWYSNILSGMPTLFLQLTGDAFNIAINSALTALTSNPKDTAQAVRGAFTSGLKQGLNEAMMALQGRSQFKPTATTDRNTISNLEILGKYGPQSWTDSLAYIASAGTLTKYVFRLFAAIDTFFQSTAREAHAYLAASRAARKVAKIGSPEYNAEFIKQLGGDTREFEAYLERAKEEQAKAGLPFDKGKIIQRAYELRAKDRPASINQLADRFANRITFTGKPEGIGRIISNIISAIQRITVGGLPIGRLLMPFNQIISSIFEQSLDYTPVGIARAAVGGHLTDIEWVRGKPRLREGATKFDPIERRQRMAAAMTGTVLGLVAYAIADMFKDEPDEDVPFMIYGQGPSNKARRDALTAMGWSPNTIKIGDTFIKYSEYPLAMVLSAFGSAMDAERYEKLDKKDALERAQYIAMSAIKGMLNQGVLSNMRKVFEVMTGDAPVSSLKDMPASAVKGLVPASGLLKDVANLMDPNKVSADTLRAAFLRDIPVAKSYAGNYEINRFGEPVKFEGLPVLRRAFVGRVENHVSDWLGRNFLTVPEMDKTIEIGQYFPKEAKTWIQRKALQMGAAENGMFTPEQNFKFQERAGKLTKAAVERVMTLKKNPRPAEREALQKIINREVEAARKKAMMEIVKEDYLK